jgi:hypothetical protein
MTAAHRTCSQPRYESWLMQVVLCTVLALCIAQLWLLQLPSSFWVDEMVSAFVVAHPKHPSLAVAPQVPASTYYWLPRIGKHIFGNSEVAWRIPSILAMGLALFFVARLAVRLIHPRSAWFAVFACLGLRGMNYHAADAPSGTPSLERLPIFDGFMV